MCLCKLEQVPEAFNLKPLKAFSPPPFWSQGFWCSLLPGGCLWEPHVEFTNSQNSSTCMASALLAGELWRLEPQRVAYESTCSCEYCVFCPLFTRFAVKHQNDILLQNVTHNIRTGQYCHLNHCKHFNYTKRFNPLDICWI